MDAIRDRNLLFGVLAVQLRGVSPAQLVEVSTAWTADPSVSVPRRLVDKGLLREEDRVFLEKLVDDTIRLHGGDSKAVLDMFGGEEHIKKTFFTGFDTQAFNRIGTSPMEVPTFFSGSGQEISGVHETPGRYTLVSHHDKGGMGRVLIVHDEYLGRNIALKELLTPGAEAGVEDKPSPVRQSAALVARFLQEARITSQLEHPAIVPVYELGRRQDGSLYYTMRLVRGKTFATALQERTSLDERLRLLSNFVSLCQAMAYAHSRGVIHRDIKPSNVMLGSFGETVVLDWGLAKVNDSDDVHQEDIRDTLHFLDLDEEHALPKTAYGRALGTPHYMPIEQAEGRIDAIDARSDVYSLGALLYEILTGAPPYSGDSIHEIIHKVIHTAYVPVLKLEPESPPELAVICEKALQKDQAKRYQSAADLAEEVQRFIDGRLVHAFRYSLRRVVAHYYSKHHVLVNTALLCAAVLLVTGAVSWVSIMQARDREHAQRLIAEHKTYQSQIQLAQACLNGREPGRATEALWATAKKERGWEWGYLLNRANPEVYTIETPNTELYSAVFNPDGDRIGTNTHPEAPAIYEAATGKKLAEMEGGPATYSHTIFSPDGSLYAGVTDDGAVNVWNAATGRRLHHFEQHAMGYDALFNRAGTMLFAAFGDRRVRAYDLNAGNIAYELEVERSPVSVSAVTAKDRLLTVSGENVTQLWDPALRKPLFSMVGRQARLSPDGTRIATVQGREAVLWDAETGAELRRFTGHQMAIYSLEFNRDGSRLLSASQDGSVILWDGATAAVVQKYELPDAVPALQAFFIADEAAVAAYSGFGACVVFSGASSLPVCSIQGKGRNGHWAAAQPKGPLVLMVPGEHLLQAVNPLAPTGVTGMVTDTASLPDAYSQIAAANGGKLLALSSSRNGTVRLIVPRTGKTVCALASSFGLVPEAAMLSDSGDRLAMIADKFVPVAVGDPVGNPVWTAFTGHSAAVGALALRPDGKQVASGDASGAVYLWDAASAQKDRALPVQKSAVTVLSFSRDGHRLLSATRDGTVTLWSTDTAAPLLTLPKEAHPIVAAALNGDATKILTINTAGAAQLWDTATGSGSGEVQITQFHDNAQLEGYPVQAQFWPGDRLFTVRLPFERKALRDVETGAPLVFLEDSEEIQPMNDGRTLAVVDRNGTVRVEDIPENAAALTPETYAHYQKDWFPQTALAVEGETPRTHVFVCREDLSRALGDLARMEALPRDGGGVVTTLADSTRTQPLAAMGLGAGDTVVAVNGVPFTDAATAKTILGAAAQQCAATEKGALPLTLTRKGHTVEYVYWTLPLTREEKAVTLTRNEALGLVQQELDALWTCRDLTPNAAWLLKPIPLRADSGDKTGLTDGFLLIGAEGKTFDSLDGMERALSDLRKRIDAGETPRFSQSFRAGAYRERTCTFTVGG